MVCWKNAETTGGRQGSQNKSTMVHYAKVYGYLDLFKTMGDVLPMQTYQLTMSKIVIGRESTCHIKINNARVSRQQCAVKVDYDKDHNIEVRLQNITSRPTTVHRNKGINPGEEIVLQHGDRFRLYDVELRYRLYDPVDEQGQLDWSRPIPKSRPPSTDEQQSGLPDGVEGDQNENDPQKIPPPLSPPLPTIKVTTADQESPPPAVPKALKSPLMRLKFDFRRQSVPITGKMDSLKLPRNNSVKLMGNIPNNNNDKGKIEQQEIMANNNRNKRLSLPGNVQTYKRRGSSDFDMRKAVLQRSFRRAFKEKISQGTLIDVNEDRFRRALEDFMVLSSAA